MRLLGFADLHGSARAVKTVLRHLRGREVDGILLAGDVTSFGGEGFVSDLAHVLPEGVPVAAVLGNCDNPGRALSEYEENGIHLLNDMESVRIGDIRVVGWVGDGAASSPSGSFETGDYVLLTHYPPYGVLDRVGSKNIGSRAVAEVVERLRPMVHLFGHVHEARGVERTQHTFFVNPGPAMWGNGAYIEIGEKGGDMSGCAAGPDVRVLLLR